MEPRRKKATGERFTRKKLSRHKATQVPEPTTFHFLALPAEIRNMIYRFLVVPYKINSWEPIEQEPHLRTKAWWHRGEDQSEYFAPYYASPQHDPTIVLLNRQVRTEFLAVYCDNARLVVMLCERCHQDLSGKNLRRVPILYLKRCTAFVNVVRVKFGPFDREWRGIPYSPQWMEKAVKNLVVELEAMYRLETLEIYFFDWQGVQRYGPEVVLKPFAKLANLRHVSVEGDLSDEYTASLHSSMMRSKTTLARRSRRDVWLRRRLRHATLQAVDGSLLEILSTVRPIQRPRAPSVYSLCEP